MPFVHWMHAWISFTFQSRKTTPILSSCTVLIPIFRKWVSLLLTLTSIYFNCLSHFNIFLLRFVNFLYIAPRTYVFVKAICTSIMASLLKLRYQSVQIVYQPKLIGHPTFDQNCFSSTDVMELLLVIFRRDILPMMGFRNRRSRERAIAWVRSFRFLPQRPPVWLWRQFGEAPTW